MRPGHATKLGIPDERRQSIRCARYVGFFECAPLDLGCTLERRRNRLGLSGFAANFIVRGGACGWKIVCGSDAPRPRVICAVVRSRDQSRDRAWLDVLSERVTAEDRYDQAHQRGRTGAGEKFTKRRKRAKGYRLCKHDEGVGAK